RLVAGERAERIHEGPLAAELPELLRAKPRERVLDLHATAQPDYVFGAIAALDVFPARARCPLLLQRLNFFFSIHELLSGEGLNAIPQCAIRHGAQQHAKRPTRRATKQGFTVP